MKPGVTFKPKLISMKRSTARAFEFCMMCIGHAVIGGMFLVLGWAFTMMFCHFFGLPVNWATQWIP